MASFNKFLLENYFSFLLYWKILLILFIIITLLVLHNNSNLLKFIILIILNLFSLFYLVGNYLIHKNNNIEEQITALSTKIKSVALPTISAIIILIFVCIIFLLSIFVVDKTQIFGFMIEQEIRYFIVSISVPILLITFIFSYLLSKLKLIYGRLNKLAKEKKYILEPNNTINLIGYGVILLIILFSFGISTELLQDSEYSTLSIYSIKSFIIIILFSFYFYILLQSNYTYILRNYYSMVNR
jgi:hypothetical protein